MKSISSFERGIERVFILASYQFDPILRIQPNLLTGRLIAQGCHVGIYSPAVAWSTMNVRGLHATKKHKICLVEGQDISPPVSGALTEFKRTVVPGSWEGSDMISKGMR